MFIFRPCLTLCLAGFNPDLGFSITNNTTQNIYVQTPSGTFDLVLANNTSDAYKGYGSYPVRNNGNVNAQIYMTVVVDASDRSVRLNSGTLIGPLTITTNFS